MKFLACLTSVSGVGWVIGLVAVTSGWTSPAWGIVATAVAYLAVAALLIGTAGSPGRLPLRLGVLWLLAVVVAAGTFAPLAGGLLLAGVSLLAATIAVLIWLSLPLVIFSWYARKSSPRPGAAAGRTRPAPVPRV